MPTIIPTEEHAKKILDLLTYGLVKGQGQPIPGKMCVEAAVCFALGLPHGDNPPCVGHEVRAFKIGLNDKAWSTTQTRAVGMRQLAVAQLGSNTLDQKAFRELLWFQLGTQIQPLIWRFLATKGDKEARLELATKMEQSKNLAECKAHAYDYAHAHAYAYAHSHDYDYAYGYGYDYGYAYDYGYDYGYGYAHDYGYDYDYDSWLSKVAAIGVQTLIDLKSPGCAFLHLCNP